MIFQTFQRKSIKKSYSYFWFNKLLPSGRNTLIQRVSLVKRIDPDDTVETIWRTKFFKSVIIRTYLLKYNYDSLIRYPCLYIYEEYQKKMNNDTFIYGNVNNIIYGLIKTHHILLKGFLVFEFKRNSPIDRSYHKKINSYWEKVKKNFPIAKSTYISMDEEESQIELTNLSSNKKETIKKENLSSEDNTNSTAIVKSTNVFAPFIHLWISCTNCYKPIPRMCIEDVLYICEICELNLLMPSYDRIESLIDSGTWDPSDENMVSIYPYTMLTDENISNEELENDDDEFEIVDDEFESDDDEFEQFSDSDSSDEELENDDDEFVSDDEFASFYDEFEQFSDSDSSDDDSDSDSSDDDSDSDSSDDDSDSDSSDEELENDDDEFEQFSDSDSSDEELENDDDEFVSDDEFASFYDEFESVDDEFESDDDEFEQFSDSKESKKEEELEDLINLIPSDVEEASTPIVEEIDAEEIDTTIVEEIGTPIVEEIDTPTEEQIKITTSQRPSPYIYEDLESFTEEESIGYAYSLKGCLQLFLQEEIEAEVALEERKKKLASANDGEIEAKVELEEKEKTLASTDDENTNANWEESSCEEEVDKHDKPYIEYVDSYQRKTGLPEAIQTGIGQLEGIPVALGVMDFEFIGGSMGSVVGEKITRLIEYAMNKSLPLIISCASGGARMQEGSFSLMQMAKISSALLDYQLTNNLLLISLLTSPTTGGVTASFGMLANIVIGEPEATIAFAGKRVIEEVMKIEVPDGIQEAEFLFEKGSLDSLVPRHLLKGVLSEILKFHHFLPLNRLLKKV